VEAALVICKSHPSSVEAVLNGLIAWAGVLGGCTAVGSGLPAASLAFSARARPEMRADTINRGLGYGFLLGIAAGLLVFICYASKLVT
jgi:hypothetical protein